MELSPSSEAANCIGTQEFPSTLWNPKVPPLVPILSQINPVYTTPTYLSHKHLIVPIYIRLGLPSGLFLAGFPTYIPHPFLWSSYMLHALSI
jgi:hypothetical protein